ncbi:hypothetical protein L1987_17160 [Smallanthus sonchifolius]|uniref:Uncharacterized protein n=1 Tax=Smallanthus sonchifolius TaxID=185202 RepID=A0ACB9IX63_9ASTR|nr:hypothetical protein L1987_17160 [Smallanthus sonchifolius]
MSRLLFTAYAFDTYVVTTYLSLYDWFSMFIHFKILNVPRWLSASIIHATWTVMLLVPISMTVMPIISRAMAVIAMITTTSGSTRLVMPPCCGHEVGVAAILEAPIALMGWLVITNRLKLAVTA